MRFRECPVPGFLGAFLALALAGCTTVAPSPSAPPAALLAATPKPLCQKSVNGDLVLCITAYDQKLDSCNNDKLALDVWAKEVSK